MSYTVNDTCNIFYNVVLEDIADHFKKSAVMTPELQAVCDRLKKPASGGPTNSKETKKPRKSPKLTGYNVYMREHRDQVRQDNPTLNSQQIVTLMASGWKKHTDEFKHAFNERAAEIQKERDAVATE